MVSKKQQHLASVSTIVSLLFFVVGSAQAETLTSSSFQIENPTISVGGGNASSASFQYSGNLGEYMIGEMSGVSFTDTIGFAYQGTTTTPAPPSPAPTVAPGSVLTPITTNAILSGVATPFAQIVAVLAGETYLGIADNQGNFSLTLRDIPSGEHHVLVRATTLEGIRSVEQDIVFTVPSLNTAYVTGIDVSGVPTEIIYDTVPASPIEPGTVRRGETQKPSMVKVEIIPSKPVITSPATSSQGTKPEPYRMTKKDISFSVVFFTALAYYIIGRYKRRHKKHIFDEHFYR